MGRYGQKSGNADRARKRNRGAVKKGVEESAESLIEFPQEGYFNPLIGGCQVAEYHNPQFDPFFTTKPPYLFRKTFDPGGNIVREMACGFANDNLPQSLSTFLLDVLIAQKDRRVFLIRADSGKRVVPDTLVTIYLNQEGRPDSCIGTIPEKRDKNSIWMLLWEMNLISTCCNIWGFFRRSTTHLIYGRLSLVRRKEVSLGISSSMHKGSSRVLGFKVSLSPSRGIVRGECVRNWEASEEPMTNQLK